MRFLTRYDGEVSEPLVRRQGSRVSMRVARGSASLLSSHGNNPPGSSVHNHALTLVTHRPRQYGIFLWVPEGIPQCKVGVWGGGCLSDMLLNVTDRFLSPSCPEMPCLKVVRAAGLQCSSRAPASRPPVRNCARSMREKRVPPRVRSLPTPRCSAYKTLQFSDAGSYSFLNFKVS